MFITVPDTTLPCGTVVPSFKVSQYACSKGEDGKIVIDPALNPWVNINYHNAVQACLDAGYQLITELQWLAIAWNVSQQDCNWTKGKVGEGKLFRGIRKGNVSSAKPGIFVPSDKKERRWMTLSNGERVCDLNGNAFSWVFDDVQGNDSGLTTTIKADSPSLTTAPYPSMEKGMGWRPDGERDWSGYALIRGGCWRSGDYAGVFRLNYGWPRQRGRRHRLPLHHQVGR